MQRFSRLADIFHEYAPLFPACAAAVFEGREVFSMTAGRAMGPDLHPVPVTENTFFDLASLTKALAAAPAAFLLAQEERLSLSDSPACSLLPTPAARLAVHLQDTTVAQLLNHSAGFPAYAPFFETASSVEDMLQSLARVQPAAPPGAQFLYSDIGYIFLGLYLSDLTGGNWTRWAKKHLFEPLGLDFSFWEPPVGASWADNREPQSRATGVHDENARILGPYCAHAGLFGSLRTVTHWVMHLCRTWHGETAAPLLPETVRRMWTPLSPSDPFTCGFDRPSAGFTTAGETADRQRVVGHLGFSGTAFWLHPERNCGGVLLTNRVSLGRYACMEELKRFRAAFFAEVWRTTCGAS